MSAGIAGLAAAAGLARSGARVVVLERQPQVSEVGAGIVLWPNAIRALAAIGLDGQLEEVPTLGGVAARDALLRALPAPVIERAMARWIVPSLTAHE